MYPEAYKEWIELFNDDFVQIWQSERKELQKTSLLLCALQKELKNVQNKVEVEVLHLKQQLKYRDDLEKRTKSLSPPSGNKKSPSTANKENNFKNQQVKHADLKKNETKDESPDLFKDIDINAHCSSANLSVIDLSISEDDSVNVEGSPTIKKRRKRYKVIPNVPAFSIITESEEKPTTPINAIRESVKTNLFKTPVAKSDHDLSVIECTPEINRKSKISSRVNDFISKKKSKSRRNNNSTLTQMFKMSSMRKKSQKADDGADSDETYFEDNSDTSKLGITELLHYINKDETRKQENDKIVQRNNEDENSQIMETSSQEVDQFSKGTIFNDEDIQTDSEKPKINAVDAEPIVRGNARKQLHGWSCQQCKDFYSHMNLSPEELKKRMDECSRHRYKYHPPEETIPGFWDLSIPPENFE